MENLQNVPTKFLVEELMQREGIETKIVPPYEPLNLADAGPCVVLVVRD